MLRTTEVSKHLSRLLCDFSQDNCIHNRREACATVGNSQLSATVSVAKLHLPFAANPLIQQEEEQSPAAREKEVRQEVTRRIKQLGQQRKFKEAVQELASLATLGIQPDTQAATALLAACTRSRDMKMAQSIFEQLFGEHTTGPAACSSWSHSPALVLRVEHSITALAVQLVPTLHERRQVPQCTILLSYACSV
jgi:hypothetical protein